VGVGEGVLLQLFVVVVGAGRLGVEDVPKVLYRGCGQGSEGVSVTVWGRLGARVLLMVRQRRRGVRVGGRWILGHDFSLRVPSVGLVCGIGTRRAGFLRTEEEVAVSEDI
jgi:hypothetical protein